MSGLAVPFVSRSCQPPQDGPCATVVEGPKLDELSNQVLRTPQDGSNQNNTSVTLLSSFCHGSFSHWRSQVQAPLVTLKVFFSLVSFQWKCKYSNHRLHDAIPASYLFDSPCLHTTPRCDSGRVWRALSPSSSCRGRRHLYPRRRTLWKSNAVYTWLERRTSSRCNARLDVAGGCTLWGSHAI